MSKTRDVIIGVLIEIVGWSAFVIAPLACAFAIKETAPRPGSQGSGASVIRGRLRWPFRWLETPDEPLPGGMYEPEVWGWYLSGPWWWCATRWLWRNRAFGLAWHFGRPASSYVDWPWQWQGAACGLRLTTGWKVYRKGVDASPLWAVPAFALRVDR